MLLQESYVCPATKHWKYGNFRDYIPSRVYIFLYIKRVVLSSVRKCYFMDWQVLLCSWLLIIFLMLLTFCWWNNALLRDVPDVQKMVCDRWPMKCCQSVIWFKNSLFCNKQQQSMIMCSKAIVKKSSTDKHVTTVYYLSSSKFWKRNLLTHK